LHVAEVSMTDSTLGFLGMIFGGFIALVVSLLIANAAHGGDGDTGWAWGFLGPVGWIIAAIKGIQPPP